MKTLTKKQVAGPKSERKADKALSIPRIIEAYITAKKAELHGKLSIIQSGFKRGMLLKKLKGLTDHGQWEKSLEQLDINGSTAARLIQLSESWLPNEILTAGQDFIQHLPLDVQKLVKLVELPPVEARKILELVDPDEQSREQFRATVDAKLLACGAKLNHRAASRVAKGTQAEPDQKPLAATKEKTEAGGIETVASEHSSQVRALVKPSPSSPEGLPLTRTNPPERNKPDVVSAVIEDGMVAVEGPLRHLQTCCQAFLDLPEKDWAALAGSADKDQLGHLMQLVDKAAQKLTVVQNQLSSRTKV